MKTTADSQFNKDSLVSQPDRKRPLLRLSPGALRTTGIGSLPHHNSDAALSYCFEYGLPFLPQIPIRNPWEYMISQALDGLPGLQLEAEGQVFLNLDIWKRESHRLSQRLERAFASSETDPGAFEAFEPSASVSSCFQPFLWELHETKHRIAKTQITGPLTAQWSLRLKDHSPADRVSELTTQIYQLVLARALAQVRRMKADGIEPVLFLDEPGLYALSLNQPKHVLALSELKLLIQTLKKEGATVGLHCCSNTHWETVLALSFDILSLDVQLSLEQALLAGDGKPMAEFIAQGGTLCLGIIPTGRSSILPSLRALELRDAMLKIFTMSWPGFQDQVPTLLNQALFSPACGLALHSVADTEIVLEKLLEVYHSFEFTS